jgi:hypothetical protein
MEKVSLNRGEYWLLEAVVGWRIRLGGLDEESWYCPAHNREPHGMPLKVLVTTFNEMLSRGYFVFSDKNDSPITSPNVEKLIKDRNPVVWYGLTPKGGALWESFARPYWDLFIDQEWSQPNEKDGRSTAVLAGMGEKRLDCYVHFIKEWLASKGFPPVEVLTRRQVKPWQATYWKQFECGHEVTIRSHPIEDKPNAFSEVSDSLTRWYNLRI